MASTATRVSAQPQISGIAASPFHRTRHPYILLPGHPPPGLSSLLRPPSFQRPEGGAGILTCFPSPTPFGLSLGTGSPWEDELDPGNLGLTARGFLTPFIATHFGISTPKVLFWLFRSSSYLPWDAPLPLTTLKRCEPEASAPDLSPVTFSARLVLTSELLRFL